MGFYDCRCMLTGVSIDFVGSVAVILRCTPNGYEPITLGLSGSYDGNVIDGIRQDRNSELVYEYFSRESRSGRFTARNHPLNDPLEFGEEFDLDTLISAIESSWSLSSASEDEDLEVLPLAVLDGSPLVYAAIAQPIWAAIAGSAASAVSLRDVFGAAEVPREIYGNALADVEPQLRELAAIDAFVRANDLRWVPPGDPKQPYPSLGEQRSTEDNAEYVAEARDRYRDTPAVLAGLDAYEVALDS